MSVRSSSRARQGLRAACGASVLVVGLAACGGGSAPPSSAQSLAGATVQPSGGRSGQDGGPGDGQRGAEFEKIRQCLQAAGIPVPTFSPGGPGGRTGTFTGRPTFSGPRPSGGFGGGFGRDFLNDPKAQQALKACGLTLPTRPPGGFRPTGAPTTSPTG